MKKVREFFNIIQFVLSRELDWYEAYVTNSVSEDYRRGYMAGIKAMRNLIADIYDRYKEK